MHIIASQYTYKLVENFSFHISWEDANLLFFYINDHQKNIGWWMWDMGLSTKNCFKIFLNQGHTMTFKLKLYAGLGMIQFFLTYFKFKFSLTDLIFIDKDHIFDLKCWFNTNDLIMMKCQSIFKKIQSSNIYKK
jgi:hypothetical protein